MKKTEKLAYTLKNDYLFIALMNSHPYTLKMLICSLLALKQEDIHSLTIRNPIKVGEAVTDKTFILDLDLNLNDDTYINIELQVVDHGNWPERSLGYLCRTYDNLNKGDDYIDTKPAIHISILDFTLFEEYPEFFATYRLLNCKNLHEYTSKFSLHVLDLSQIDMATAEDKQHRRDVWSRVFQSTTWGDLMAIAEEYQDFAPVVEQINRLTADEAVRLHCEARERAIIHEQAMQRKINNLEGAMQEKDAALQEKDVALQKKDTELHEKDAALQEKEVALQEKDAEIARLLDEMKKMTNQ